MVKINVYPIRSELHNKTSISASSQQLLDDLTKLTGYTFNIVDLEDLYKADLGLILVQSGGSEGKFKAISGSLKAPYLLLTYGTNNSLASSLEILTYIRKSGQEGEILHGDPKYIAARLKALVKDDGSEKEEDCPRLGVIGKPSDWLIASDVDYGQVRKIFHIQLVDLTTDELKEKYLKLTDTIDESKLGAKYNQEELNKAYRVYLALKEMVNEYHLAGLTIRCFDLLTSLKTTSCLALSLLNKDGIIASCEGDIPSMLSCYTIRKIVKESAFQANPSSINTADNSICLAHCTLPLDMASSYVFDTHFESGIGVGIHAEMKKGPVTVLKIGSTLDSFFCSEGELTDNYYKPNLCRTQIRIALKDDVSYFLKKPLGNHHLICYGSHKAELVKYLTSLGLKEIK